MKLNTVKQMLWRAFGIRKFAGLVIFVLALAVMGSTAWADQIYVCTGCTSPPGGDPNVIDPASINIGFAGNHSAVSPLLVIVGVPNGGPMPTISLPGGVSLTSLAYGAHATGTLTSSNFPSAYAAVGLATGSPSESWVNWSAFDTAHGFNVGTSFALYVFSINFALNSGPGGNSPINIDFSGINAGSFVIGYACEEAGSTCAQGDTGSTPFTNAGVVVPEPGTLALFGTGLLGIAGLIRRRLSS